MEFNNLFPQSKAQAQRDLNTSVVVVDLEYHYKSVDIIVHDNDCTIILSSDCLKTCGQLCNSQHTITCTNELKHPLTMNRLWHTFKIMQRLRNGSFDKVGYCCKQSKSQKVVQYYQNSSFSVQIIIISNLSFRARLRTIKIQRNE